jgi:hypothetical protein
MVVLVTWALLGLNALSGICFGSDGHVALESMVQPHQKLVAAAALEGHKPISSAVLSKESEHGPCFDVPLEQGSGTQIIGGKSYSPEVAKIQAAEAHPMSLPVLLEPMSDGLVESACETSLVHSVRSTILRI